MDRDGKAIHAVQSDNKCKGAEESKGEETTSVAACSSVMVDGGREVRGFVFQNDSQKDQAKGYY